MAGNEQGHASESGDSIHPSEPAPNGNNPINSGSPRISLEDDNEPEILENLDMSVEIEEVVMNSSGFNDSFVNSMDHSSQSSNTSSNSSQQDKVVENCANTFPVMFLILLTFFSNVTEATKE